jgi:uncharacterized phage infection (PIP) family protein YhgE
MKVLGWLAMIAAVIAIVVGLVVAAGVWVAKPQVQERAEELLIAADEGLVRADELLDRVDAGVETATGAVTKLNETAQSLAADPIIDEATRTQLATSIEGFMTGPYADLQARYAGLKEGITSITQLLTLADRVLPGVELPGNVSETLIAVDAAVQKINATITTGADRLTTTLTGPNAATRLAEQTQRLEDALVVVNDLLPKIDERLTQAQGRVAGATENVGTWFTAGAVVVTLLGLYLAGLNVLLFQKGREWSRRSKDQPTAA